MYFALQNESGKSTILAEEQKALAVVIVISCCDLQDIIMNSSFNDSGNWVLSQGDYLAGLSRQLRASRRQRSFQRKTAGVLLLVFAVGIGTLVASRQSGIDNTRALMCNDVQQNMHAYLDGTLEQPLKLRFEEHLQTCPRCREVMGKLQAKNTPERVHHDLVAAQKNRYLRSRGLVLAQN